MAITDDLQLVFKHYCDTYKEIFQDFKPWIGTKRTINEANQVHHFLEAYKDLFPGAITWMELPIHDRKEPDCKENVTDSISKSKAYTARIDGFILSQVQKRIIFIEAKRFSRKNKVESLKEDAIRIKRILDKIFNEDEGKLKNLDLDQYEVATLFLADAWDKKPEIVNHLDKHLKELDVDGLTRIDKSEPCSIGEGYHLMYRLMEYSPKPCKK